MADSEAMFGPLLSQVVLPSRPPNAPLPHHPFFAPKSRHARPHPPRQRSMPRLPPSAARLTAHAALLPQHRVPRERRLDDAEDGRLAGSVCTRCRRVQEGTAGVALGVARCCVRAQETPLCLAPSLTRVRHQVGGSLVLHVAREVHGVHDDLKRERGEGEEWRGWGEGGAATAVCTSCRRRLLRGSLQAPHCHRPLPKRAHLGACSGCRPRHL